MAKADKALSARRADDILRIRLDGAEFLDVRDFVREKEKDAASLWFLAEGEKPLSDSQLYRYIQRADELMVQHLSHERGKLIREHRAKRRHLYSRAALAGDVGNALRCLRDEAELLGLYPSAETELRKELDELRDMLKRITDGTSPPAPGDSPASPADRGAPDAGDRPACPPAV